MRGFFHEQKPRCSPTRRGFVRLVRCIFALTGFGLQLPSALLFVAFPHGNHDDDAYQGLGLATLGLQLPEQWALGPTHRMYVAL